MKEQDIRIEDYNYELPAKKIAHQPLDKRDHSRLLLYTNGSVEEDIFSNMHKHLPTGASLFFNNSKVIKARLSFAKSTGSIIEVFLLEPYPFSGDHYKAMQLTRNCSWQCMVGGAAKWKEPFLTKEINIAGKQVTISIKKQGRIANDFIVEFNWDSDDIFANILEVLGQMPLPPYIKRDAVPADETRYQTIYAAQEGSVAAPTAGLHFTEEVLTSLSAKQIRQFFMTLHVGAGTFLPVKAATMQGHDMHAEFFEITQEQLSNLLHATTIIAVGTTSLRMLESIYWLGVKLLINPKNFSLELGQWELYEDLRKHSNISTEAAFNALKQYLQDQCTEVVLAKTAILIVPGYRFKVANFLTTNFHQPKSTLLLLVAAAVGKDWKMLYDYALQNNFRFLSYGDTSLLKTNKPSNL